MHTTDNFQQIRPLFQVLVTFYKILFTPPVQKIREDENSTNFHLNASFDELRNLSSIIKEGSPLQFFF